MTIDNPVTTGNLYVRLWKRVPRELGFLILTFPVAAIGSAATTGLFNSGLGSVFVFFIGVFVVIGALYVSRGFAIVELVRLRWAGQPPIQEPNWRDAQASTGFWPWFRSVAGNGRYWLALLHSMIVNFVVSLVTWLVTILWIAIGIGGVTFLLWGRLQSSPSNWHLSRWLFGVSSPINPAIVDPILYFIVGAFFFASLPFVTRVLTLAHWGIARGMLGSSKSDALRRQVRDLNAARGAASAAEGHSLRRLERDIHDGPQQRLVRIQMDLAAADRAITQDTGEARELIGGAMQQAKDALEELRALSRGFAPPILLDRGLVPALESAATRSSVPTTVVNELPSGTTIPQELERNAYFVASEALTNAIKHAGATTLTITVGIADDRLTVSVADDGKGGAAREDGHGLAGLEERMRGAGGSLELTSPSGGPTVVTAHFPLA